MNLPPVSKEAVSGKRVFVRMDLDVPIAYQKSKIKNQKYIEDDTRLKAGLPTLEFLLKNNAKVLIGGHLGRPNGIDKNLSLEPVAKWLFKEFKIRKLKFEFKLKIENLKLTKMGDFEGWQIGPNIFLLENLRFYKGEAENDLEFAKKLASLADIYVNDAFAMCHRNHASVVGITHFLPHFSGLHLEKEIANLSTVMENPTRPLVVVIGGKKIETKLPLVSKMHQIADYVLVGGKIAQEKKVFLDLREEKIAGKKCFLLIADLTSDKLSIAKKSLDNFLNIIALAKTIIWNGTMGYICEKEDQFQATRKIAQAIIKSQAYSVVGGGDTTEFLRKIGLIDKFSFASTGGGAMLSFLAGEKLPGVEALKTE